MLSPLVSSRRHGKPLVLDAGGPRHHDVSCIPYILVYCSTQLTLIGA